MSSGPDLQTLRLFLSVLDLRNLTGAARRHNIAPSAVTKRLKDLERHYGVELFRRSSRGVAPTVAGEELARHVRDLLGRMDQIEGTMSEFTLGVRGQVRVHASASVLMEALIGSIATFTRTHPLIRIELQESMSWRIVRNVAEGLADVGVVAGTAEIPADLNAILYREDRLMVLLPVDHPLARMTAISFEQALDFDHVGLGTASAISIQLAEEAGRVNRTIRYSYRTATYDVARMMVAQGLGIAILPKSLVLPYAETLQLVVLPLSDPWSRREMRICHREAALTAAGRLYIEHLTAEAALALATLDRDDLPIDPKPG